MHLMISSARERAYSHRGWEIWPNHDCWNCQDFRWNVYAPGEDEKCLYVGTLSQAKAAINEELFPPSPSEA